MKSTFLATGLIFTLQSASALQYTCQNDETNHTLMVTATMENKLISAVSIETGSVNFTRVLPCTASAETESIVCEVVFGNPNGGGGCMNPYNVDTFIIYPSGVANYSYVSNGFIFDKGSYTCVEA